MIIWQLNTQARMVFLFKLEGTVLSQNSFQRFTGSPSDSRGKKKNIISTAWVGDTSTSPSAASDSTATPTPVRGAPGGSRLKIGMLIIADVGKEHGSGLLVQPSKRPLRCLLPGSLDEQEKPQQKHSQPGYGLYLPTGKSPVA